MESENKNLYMKFRCTKKEKDKIIKRMSEAGQINFSKYAVNLLSYGAIINIDFKEVKNYRIEMSRIGNNINQIARKSNEADIDENDIIELKNMMSELVESQKGLLDLCNKLQELKVVYLEPEKI